MSLNPLVRARRPPERIPSEFGGLDGRRILVTGAGGFIGGALYQRLLSYGLDVLGTVQHEQEARTLRDRGFPAAALDLADDGPWDELVEGRDLVFHVAAAFQETELSEAAYDRINHRAVERLARTAARAGVSRFVHCSTVGVHGDVLEIPATEETPFNPMDLYHRTKLAGELAVVRLAGELGPDRMVVVVNRPAMIYGPGDTRMLKLYRAILGGVFVMIGSGRTLAHLGYVEDLVDSFLLCALADAGAVHGEAFNIASGTPIRLDDLARLIAEAGGVRWRGWRVPLGPVLWAGRLVEAVCRPLGLRPPLSPRRVGFFSHNRAFDLSKARRRLGYEPKWLPERGVPATIAWYRREGLL